AWRLIRRHQGCEQTPPGQVCNPSHSATCAEVTLSWCVYASAARFPYANRDLLLGYTKQNSAGKVTLVTSALIRGNCLLFFAAEDERQAILSAPDHNHL